jgi:hypothetical protein
VLHSKKTRRRFLRRLISISDFRNGLHVPGGGPFLLKFPGFANVDAVQEHSDDGAVAL